MSAVLFERLEHRGAALAEPLLERVGELCAAAAEAAEAADAEDEEEGEEGAVGMQYAGAAAAAMSAALRHLGPENVLRDLPLNLEEVRGAPLWLFLMVVCPVSQIEGHCSRKSYLIRSLLAPSLTLEQEQVLHRAGLNSAHMCHTDDVLWQGLEGRGEARTWLLPMLRQHVSNARLGFWGSVLLPLARRMGSVAANPAHPHALACRALEAQLWNCLPSFASWPEDTATAFQCVRDPLHPWDLNVMCPWQS